MSRWFLAQAVLTALAIEGLLWGVRSGPGWAALVLFALATSHILRRRLERRAKAWTAWLWLAAGMFAASTTLYDADLVHLLSPLLCGLSLTLAIHHSIARSPALESLISSPLLERQAGDQVWRTGIATLPPMSGPTARGLLLAFPLVSLFGLLFIQADPAYAAQLQSLGLEWQSWLGTALRCLFWSWWVGTVLWTAQGAAPSDSTSGRQGQDDPTTWATALHSVNLLFLSFLALQGRYLFSGRSPAGMTLANYARHGFFELFIATLLVVALVVWVHRAVYASLESRSKAGPAAALLVALTFGLVASSALRMHLYISHFGLTLTRAYVVLTLVGITATLGLCLWALLSWRHPAWLQSRLVLLGLLSMASVSLTNVEGWVGRVNLARPEVDYAYLQGLSCDLAGELNPNIPEQRQILELLSSRADLVDWREWNWSRYRATWMSRDNVARHPLPRSIVAQQCRATKL